MQQEPLSTLYIHSQGAMRGETAQAPHRPLPSLAPCLCLFHLQLLELPFPLQLLTVPMLSSQPFTWGLRLQESGQGVQAPLKLISMFTLIIYHFEFSSERPPRINKNFRFLAK